MPSYKSGGTSPPEEAGRSALEVDWDSHLLFICIFRGRKETMFLISMLRMNYILFMKSTSLYTPMVDGNVYKVFDQSGQRYLGQVDMIYIMCASLDCFNCK